MGFDRTETAGAGQLPGARRHPAAGRLLTRLMLRLAATCHQPARDTTPLAQLAPPHLHPRSHVAGKKDVKLKRRNLPHQKMYVVSLGVEITPAEFFLVKKVEK